MKCSDTQALIDAWLDARIEGHDGLAEKSILENHLKNHKSECLSCQNEWQAAQKYFGITVGMKAEETPLDFEKGVYQQIEKITANQGLKVGSSKDIRLEKVASKRIHDSTSRNSQIPNEGLLDDFLNGLREWIVRTLDAVARPRYAGALVGLLIVAIGVGLWNRAPQTLPDQSSTSVQSSKKISINERQESESILQSEPGASPPPVSPSELVGGDELENLASPAPSASVSKKSKSVPQASPQAQAPSVIQEQAKSQTEDQSRSQEVTSYEQTTDDRVTKSGALRGKGEKEAVNQNREDQAKTSQESDKAKDELPIKTRKTSQSSDTKTNSDLQKDSKNPQLKAERKEKSDESFTQIQYTVSLTILESKTKQDPLVKQVIQTTLDQSAQTRMRKGSRAINHRLAEPGADLDRNRSLVLQNFLEGQMDIVLLSIKKSELDSTLSLLEKNGIHLQSLPKTSDFSDSLVLKLMRTER